MAGNTSESLVALDWAQKQLTEELNRARDEWGRNGHYVTGDMPTRIEGLVQALHAIPGGQAELQQRAGLVARLCGEGSHYAAERAAFLADDRQPSGMLPKMLVRQIGNAPNPPRTVSELMQTRQAIERLQEDRHIAQALEPWRAACIDAIDKARQLEADGCHWLYHVHAARGDNRSDRSLVVKAMLCGGTMGGALLDGTQAAADVLTAWAANAMQGEEDGGGNPSDGAKKQISPAKRGPTVNARMKAEMVADLEKVKGFTAQQWATHLGCGKSTVIEAETWKSLNLLRQQALIERRQDRRRTRRK